MGGDALAAAEKGFETWRHVAPIERAKVLMKAAALMRERQEEIALAITAEHGKPLPQARLEVIRGCEFFEWDAGEATRTYGRVIPSAPGVRHIVHHQPIGVVAAFSPWNFPMSQPCRKVAGAIADRVDRRLIMIVTDTGAALLTLLIAGTVLVLRPFIISLILAAVLAYASWPVYEWLLARLRERAGAAATAMTPTCACRPRDADNR